ncbi:MAG: 3-dehydroquinate synthase, partial [Bacteroidales bacterium]|nr:3-dehydroquinate synthase [Bacteroidales bacterium]
EDLYESGLRRVLNLGHTFAHGIEHLSQKWNWFNKPTPIPHGDAVAMGIVLVARLSHKVGLCPEPLDERLRDDFLSCGLRVDCPYSPKEILKAAKTDKKAEGDIVHFVLLRGIGDVVIKDMKISEAIRAMENA